ncbi:hypothetical protein IWX91DRAFT_110712 [Phyllosticta citricarpa]
MLLATVHEAFLFPDAALQPSDLSMPLGMKLPRWRPIAAGHGRPCHLRQLVRSSRVPMAQTGRGGKSQHANCRHQISLTRFPIYTNHKYLGAVLLGVRHEAAAHAPSIVDATDVGARLLAGRWENQPVLYGPNIYCISALSDFLFFFFFFTFATLLLGFGYPPTYRFSSSGLLVSCFHRQSCRRIWVVAIRSASDAHVLPRTRHTWLLQLVTHQANAAPSFQVVGLFRQPLDAWRLGPTHKVI